MKGATVSKKEEKGGKMREKKREDKAGKVAES